MINLYDLMKSEKLANKKRCRGQDELQNYRACVSTTALMLEFVGRGPVKPISLFYSLNGEWPTLSLNLVNDRIYRYKLSAI